MADDRFDTAYVRGVKMDKWEAQLLTKLLAKFPRLIITQGPWSNAEASGGTHRGAGVVDLYLGGHRWQDVLEYAFEIGWFGWRRAELWIGKRRIWKEHLHLGVRGHKGMAASLKAQQTSWTNIRNGLQGNAADAFRWRPKNFRSPAPYAKAKPKPSKPAKPAREVLAWFNAAFQNAHWNSKAGGTLAAVKRTVQPLCRIATKGTPAVVGFAEIPPGYLSILVTEMTRRGYLLSAYEKRNMLAAFHRPHVKVLGSSFAPFSQQDGGNVEGALRVKYRIGGSRTNGVWLHLDHDSTEAKKKSNLREAVAAAKRYGRLLLPDWRSRTFIMGDFNDPDVGQKVLRDLGFKLVVSAKLDKGYVGDARPTRGGTVTETPDDITDHPRIDLRMGRY
jgi:hypothetical protein